MKKKAFERQYAKNSGVSVEWLHEHYQEIIPCNCKEEGCKGWQMINKNGFMNK